MDEVHHQLQPQWSTNPFLFNDNHASAQPTILGNQAMNEDHVQLQPQWSMNPLLFDNHTSAQQTTPAEEYTNLAHALIQPEWLPGSIFNGATNAVHSIAVANQPVNGPLWSFSQLPSDKCPDICTTDSLVYRPSSREMTG